jgi:antitoxin HigA-1
MDMHDPAHPGELLQGWIDDLNMSVTAFDEHIGISRPMLSRILNGHAAFPPTWISALPKRWEPLPAIG